MKQVDFNQIQRCPICEGKQLKSLNCRTEFAQNSRDCFYFKFNDCVCQDCGYVFSLNRPSQFYLNDYYKNYLSSLSNVSAHELDKRIQILQPFLNDHSNVLEIGGGYSKFSDILTGMGHFVFREDPSLISDPLITNHGFDLICSYYVGEHVLDVNEWIVYQKDLLAPNGLLLIEVPNFAAYPLESMNNEHINHFQMIHLHYLLNKHGITVVAASEVDVGRYFGMWVIGKVAEEGLYLDIDIDVDVVENSCRIVNEATAAKKCSR